MSFTVRYKYSGFESQFQTSNMMKSRLEGKCEREFALLESVDVWYLRSVENHAGPQQLPTACLSMCTTEQILMALPFR
jgi:hypothetical protein